jgi:cytochrome P450
LNNPRALEKVKEEIDLHIGKERLCITESDINKLVYLQAVVKETLRLYPASPLSGIREFREDCKIGGYHVKKGTRLFTNLWKIQTDPSVWSDPLEFKPERFLTTHKDVDVKGQHFEFLPFGSGRRICPGISFGLRSAYLTLANFLHAFEVLKPSDEPIDITAVVETTNIKVTPLEVLIKPRLSPDYYKTI